MIVGIIIILIFVLAGMLLGQHINIPYSSYQYVAVAILACLDSVFGAIVASTGKNFKMKIFLSGFFFNALFSIFLVYLGELLHVELYLAAIIVFGGRILNNFSLIRRDVMERTNINKRYKKRRERVSNNTIRTDQEAQEKNEEI